MGKNKNIVGFITARGGSKGIPRKNIKLLNGKPLVSYSIDASINSNLISETYVSTEDEEIADISRNFGANIIKRPVELSQDTTGSVEVILHALDYLEDIDNFPDFFVLLQPTSPLRDSNDVDEAIDLFINSDANALVSVYEQDHSSMLSLKVDKDNYIAFDFDKKLLGTPRQKLNPLYAQNGAIYIVDSEVFRKDKTFFPDKTIPYIMSRYKSVDVDEMFDLELAEFLLSKN